MTLAAQGDSGALASKAHKPTVVVVDDDDVTLTATAEVLQRAGYRVIVRDRPAGCIAMMLQEKPDLLLLDVCMPTVSGDTLAKLYLKAAPTSKTIVLLHSALDEPLLRSKTKAAGAHGYIIKTNDGAALLRAIRRWLKPSVIDLRAPQSERLEREPLSSVSSARLAAAHGSSSQFTAQRATSSSSSQHEIAAPASTRIPSGLQNEATAPASVRLWNNAQRGAMSGEMKRVSGAFPLSAARVLFVDDDMQTLSGYRRQLLGQPFEFDFALSGAQALRLVTSAAPPNVVVLDLLMPEIDGREVLRRALDLDPTWSQRFIIVTGQTFQDAKRQLDRRFAGTVLCKPLATAQLVNAIGASLGGGSVRASTQPAR